jgi:hypothetical protein
MDRRLAHPALAGLLILITAAAACSSGDGSSPTGSTGSSPGASPGTSPSPVPSPADPGGGAGGTLVFPVPGVIDPQPVTVESISAGIQDGRIVVRLDWTSGVEPCYSLAGVDVARDGDTFILTVFEGTADPDAVCIEIAMLKATLVDLGEQPAGEYTIRTDPAGAEPVTITVP